MFSLIYLSLASAICALMGLYLLWKRTFLFFTGRRASGTFVRWEMRGLRTMYFYPVVRFEAHDGKVYEFVGEPGTSSKKEKKRYSILYPPATPSGAMVHGPLAYWGAPIVFFVLAAGACAAAIKQL